jgi:hypothetical protein
MRRRQEENRVNNINEDENKWRTRRKRNVGDAEKEKRMEDKEKGISKDKNWRRRTNGEEREKNKEGGNGRQDREKEGIQAEGNKGKEKDK